MAVSETELSEIDTILAPPDAGSSVFAALRQRFPQLFWTLCDDSDMTDEPFRAYPQFDLHLLDTSDHCAQVTSDPARATGIILAKRSGAS